MAIRTFVKEVETEEGKKTVTIEVQNEIQADACISDGFEEVEDKKKK